MRARIALVFAAVVASLAGASQAQTTVEALVGKSPEGAAASFSRPLERRAVVFADGVRLERLTAPDACLFDISDGSRSRALWLLVHDGKVTLAAPTTVVRMGEDRRLTVDPRPMLAGRQGDLPLQDGSDGLEQRLKRAAIPAEATVALRCVALKPAPRPSPAEALAALPLTAVGAVVFSPVSLFGVPSENRSRVAAAREGAAVLGRMGLGERLPEGIDGFAIANRRLVRVLRDPGSGYAVLSIDLGGAPTNGVAQPRDAAFVGIRDGVVIWIAEPGSGIEGTLCTDAGGGSGRHRPGCSTTGFYSPRP